MKIQVDGIEYTVEVGTQCEEVAVVTVRDINGKLVADAEVDEGNESVYYDYYTDQDGRIDGGSISDLYGESACDIATWLVATHPRNS